MLITEVDFFSHKADIESFRGECYGDGLQGLSDLYDEEARHFIMKDRLGTIIGMARVLRSDEATHFEVIDEELLARLPLKPGQIFSESSRLCVLKSGLNRRFVQLMHFLADYHIRESIERSVVCLDAAHASLYTNLGFQDLGIQANSRHFVDPGHVMLIDPKKLAQMLLNKNSSRRLAKAR